MTYSKTNIPLFYSATFSQQAEVKLIKQLLESPYFKEPYIQRRLASYPVAVEEERDVLILEIINHLWKPANGTVNFSAFRDFELIFEILEKRGHFIHQFEVFVFGWSIIVKMKEQDAQGSLFSPHFENENDLFRSWLIASTAHDFGYPLEMAAKISEKLSELYKKLHMNELSKKYELLLPSYSLDNEGELTRLKIYIKQTKTKWDIDLSEIINDGIDLSITGTKKDAQSILNSLKSDKCHSYASALVFCRSYLEYYLKLNKSDPSTNKKIKLIAAAIALHSLSINKEMISFNKNPIAYLLFIADNLQDWNRTLRTNEEWPTYSLGNLEYNRSGITLSYTLDHENWTTKRRELVAGSIEDKDFTLHSPQPPSPRIDYNIIVTFTASDGYKFKDIRLSL